MRRGSIWFRKQVEIFTLCFFPAVKALLGAPPQSTTDSGLCLGWKGSTATAVSSLTGTSSKSLLGGSAEPSPVNSDPRRVASSVLEPSTAIFKDSVMHLPASDWSLICTFFYCEDESHHSETHSMNKNIFFKWTFFIFQVKANCTS